MPTYDVCIVGGGPGGLAALSALLEPYSQDQLSAEASTRAYVACHRSKHCALPRICVVDPEPWLSSWKERFAALQIDWLRSPGVAHPDAFDSGALHAYAVMHGREGELLDNAAASESLRSLQEVGAGMWRLPSTSLFADFCDDLVSKLPHDFKQARALDIHGEDGSFSVKLDNGEEVDSSAVVLAIGFPGPPIVPAPLAGLDSPSIGHTDHNGGAILNGLRPEEKVLVVGGGLTAVQAAQKAHRRGCHVSLLTRRALTTRQFDVDVKWFDRRQNRGLHFKFLEKSPEHRLRMIKETRGGGSVPPMYMEDLRERVGHRLELLRGDMEAASLAGGAIEVVIGGEVRTFDRVISACGHRPDCASLPITQRLLQRWPTETVCGLPVLTQDLQWPQLNCLFVLGALASLQVGPDAGNLMGLRRAAQVVVSALDTRAWLKAETSVLGNIRGNRFSALGDSDDSSSESGSSKSSGSDSESDDTKLLNHGGEGDSDSTPTRYDRAAYVQPILQPSP